MRGAIYSRRGPRRLIMTKKRQKKAGGNNKKTANNLSAGYDLEMMRREARDAAILAYYQRQMAGDRLKPSEISHLEQLQNERDQENAPAVDGENIADVSALCEYTGFTPRMVYYHAGKNFPRNQDGSFPKLEVDRYLAERRGLKPAGPIKTGNNGEPGNDAGESKNTENVDDEIKKADLKYKRARALKEQIFAEQIRGTLYSKAEVLTEWTARVAVICEGLEALADRLPPLLVGLSAKEMQATIRTEIRILRESYAKNGKYTPRG